VNPTNSSTFLELNETSKSDELNELPQFHELNEPSILHELNELPTFHKLNESYQFLTIDKSSQFHELNESITNSHIGGCIYICVTHAYYFLEKSTEGT